MTPSIFSSSARHTAQVNHAIGIPIAPQASGCVAVALHSFTNPCPICFSHQLCLQPIVATAPSPFRPPTRKFKRLGGPSRTYISPRPVATTSRPALQTRLSGHHASHPRCSGGPNMSRLSTLASFPKLVWPLQRHRRRGA